MACTPKKLKICSGCSCFCFIVFLVLAIIFPIIIENFILSEGRSQAIMKSSNQNLWGEVPGDSGAFVTRQFFFYNFTNAEEFLYKNASPIFQEVGPYSYQEFQNFTNYDFSTDVATGQEQIDYNFFNYFKHINGTGNPTDKIHTLNLGTLGVWYQANTAPKKKVALQAFSSIIYTLEEYLYLIACAQGIFAQFIKTEENLILTVFENFGFLIPKSMYHVLWSDEKYGWGSWSSLRKWILAAQGGYYSATAYEIRDYFSFSYEQLLALLQPIQTWLTSVQALIKDWYCEGKLPCDGLYLTALQMASQNVTMNPPSGTIPPNTSIVSSNDTLRGCPEISYFLNAVFLKNQKFNTSSYRNVSFPTLWVYNLFNHTKDAKNWLKRADIILNVGNLDFVFNYFEKFESSNKTNVSILEPVKERFHLNTSEQVHVFVEWVNYICEEFAMQKSRNGTAGTAALGTFLGLEFYHIYNKLNDFLLLDVLSSLMLSTLKKNNITCEKFFIGSSLNSSQALSVCSNISDFNESSWLTDTTPMKIMINLCWYRDNETWINFTKKAGIKHKNLQFVCDSDIKNNRSFNSIKTAADLRVHDFYNCLNISTKCSQTEFTAKQWGNSTVTRNPIPELMELNPQKYVVSDSVSEWDKFLFPKPFEYYAIIKKNPQFTTNNTIEGWDTQTSRRLLSFERLFNQMIRFIINDYDMGDTSDVERLFKVKDIKALYNYLKYSMIEHALQGFTQTRTVDELLWGYQDPFLMKNFVTADPQRGGDPSINPIVNLVNNYTEETMKNNTQSVFSGASDYHNVRIYNKIYNMSYITFNNTDFNGNDSYVLYTNPWQEEVIFDGTDSFANNPNLDEGIHLRVYVPDLFRGGYGLCNGETATYNGVDSFRFRLVDSFMFNKTRNPENAKYYMDRWNGLLNLTSVKKLPLFVSKYHYLDTDEEVYNNIKIYSDANLTQEITPDREFDIKLDIEPYSGAALYAKLNIQTNYEYQKDRLFMNEKYSMIPVFGLQRGGGWSNSAIDSKFGLLRIGLKLKLALQIVFYILAGIFLILTGYLVWRIRKNVNDGLYENPNEALLPVSKSTKDFIKISNTNLKTNEEISSDYTIMKK